MRTSALVFALLLSIANFGCRAGTKDEFTAPGETLPKPIDFDPASIEIEGDPGSFVTSLVSERIVEGLDIVTFRIESPIAAAPPKIALKWKVPSADIAGFWMPRISLDKATYWANLNSRAARYAPVVSLFNNSDANRITYACSDGLRSIDLAFFLKEEDVHFYHSATLFNEKSPAITEYEIRLRFDTRPISLSQALKGMADWWAAQENYQPAPVPDSAKQPMYSTWYSFHQNITADEVVEQCRLAKDIGFEAVIVDDGWQTLDSRRGYAYTGDWEPVRIGDMRDFVNRVHALDMKFLLWYSLSLMGKESKNYPKYQDKVLWQWVEQGSSVLDPRFPEVREFIISTYETALQEWNLDGFKLDFIGMFRPDEDTRFEATGGRDFASLDEAVDRLMTDIVTRLRTIKPDIMIEFRQPYIGPLMRKYGNMFRATDCPNMALVNRVRTTDLRLLSGDTAVHSDMFVWHPTDPVEAAALQILNILFSVPQLSVKLDEIPPDHNAMVKFWIGYWVENRDVLLDGDFLPMNPSANYPLIMSSTPEKTIAALYNDMVVALDHEDYRQIDVVNAKGSAAVVLDLEKPMGRVTTRIYDCLGGLRSEKPMTLARGVHKFSVPASGLLEIARR
jgi:alpha-galactosidase